MTFTGCEDSRQVHIIPSGVSFAWIMFGEEINGNNRHINSYNIIEYDIYIYIYTIYYSWIQLEYTQFVLSCLLLGDDGVRGGHTMKRKGL